MMKFYKHYSEAEAKPQLWVWPNFSPRELASKREGELGIDPASLDKLEALRARLGGHPLLITSAYRSKAHNKAVKGATNSMHLQGKAFDVRMDNHDPHEFETAARAVGFTGFGYYPSQGFMHIDTGPARTWGTPFAKTPNRLAAVDQAPKVTQEKVVIGAGGVGLAGIALESAPALSNILGNLAPVAQTIAVVALLAVIGYALFRIMRRGKEG